MKLCSVSSIIRERQIKTTVRYYFTFTSMAIVIKKKKRHTITSVDKNVEKLECSYVVSENTQWFSPCPPRISSKSMEDVKLHEPRWRGGKSVGFDNGLTWEQECLERVGSWGSGLWGL